MIALSKRTLACTLAFLLLATGCSKKEWQEFSSAEGRFSVMMPDAPEQETSDIPTPLGSIRLHTFSVSGFMRTFAVAYSDYPARPDLSWDGERVFDGARDEVLKRMSATLKSQQTLNVDGRPARLLEMETEGYRIKAKLIWVEPRLYQVMAVVRKGSSSAEDVDRFLQSFKLM